MKSKKPILIILGAIAFVVLIVAACIGFKAAPTVNHALRISELLEPVVHAQNQTVHIAVSAELGGKPLSLDSNVYLVAEDGRSYLAVEQNGPAVYIADNVLFLENGKAFKIGETMQVHSGSYRDLLPYIGSLFEILQITAEETETGAVYSITVTGEQAETILSVASLGGSVPTDGIETLNLSLTEKGGKLDHITFKGSGNWENTAVSLNVTLSGFRVLAGGDYPIPDAVKHSAATVNPNELFSLTDDLYTLVVALAPLAGEEAFDGTLDLTVDCGLLQVDTQLELSDLKSSSDSQIDPEKLHALPELLGWMVMEGDIRCTQQGAAYVYTLELNQQAMQDLSKMILPELSQYSSNLTAGNISILLESNAVSSIRLSIEGKISALFAQVPLHIEVAFSFQQSH